MRKWTAAILAMTFTTMAIANEYESSRFKCTATADISTLSAPQTVSLPKAIRFEFEAVSLVGSKKILRINKSNDPLNVNVKKKRRGSKIYTLSFPEISAEDSRSILIEMGATDVPSLPKGFKLRSAKNGMCGWIEVSECTDFRSKSQIHFERSHLDGLSYHLNLHCEMSL